MIEESLFTVSSSVTFLKLFKSAISIVLSIVSRNSGEFIKYYFPFVISSTSFCKVTSCFVEILICSRANALEWSDMKENLGIDLLNSQSYLLH